MKPKLLIVDDDEDIRTQMKWALASDYDVALAGDRTAAMTAFTANRPTVTLLDLGLPPRPQRSRGRPCHAFGAARRSIRSAKVIIVSGQGEKQNALRAVGAGAYDFLCKPVDMELLTLLLQRCTYVSELEAGVPRQAQDTKRSDVFEDMIGASPQMQVGVHLHPQGRADQRRPVLILGESGTGKEMVARRCTAAAPQSRGPFIAINCNAIPENLLESELFGHEKGAFTGAHMQRKGHIESAAGGTLFLDEIGDLPPAVQVKLLRFLQEKSFQRVGGRQEIQSDARVIAATNVNLREMVAAGKFREDLYFRLAVVVVKIPAVRERAGDIGLLASEFLHRYGAQHGKPAAAFAPDALRALELYPWPGNVRELQNRVQRAVIMAETKRVTAKDLELADVVNTAPPQSLKEARETVEREMVREALRRHNGKITSAALELGISRPTLYELIEKLGMGRDS